MNERDMDDNVKMMAVIRGIKAGAEKTPRKNTRTLSESGQVQLNHNVLQVVLTGIENKTRME